MYIYTYMYIYIIKYLGNHFWRLSIQIHGCSGPQNASFSLCFTVLSGFRAVSGPGPGEVLGRLLGTPECSGVKRGGLGGRSPPN